ncbi:MAG: enoyl-CoA hydratase [Parvibaculaceae bacterium]
MPAVAPAPQGETPPLKQSLGNDGVLRLVFDRPERRNPLSEAMLDALDAALGRAAADDAVRVVVIAASGIGFSAGHDLAEMTAHRRDADGGKAYFAWLMQRCSGVMQAVTACPKPVIAEVHGIATAAGCQLVASCDLAVASDDARFATSGVNLGLFCSTPMVAVSRAVGRKAALGMLLSGEFIDAAEALRIGLVNRVVPGSELKAATLELARTLAAKPPAVLALGKRAFYEQAGLPLGEAYAHCSNVMVENLMMPEAQEGISAFLEKRPPDWPKRG